MSETQVKSRRRESDKETILEVRDASVRFEMDRGVSRVLNNVSIDIEREEILGIVGESGSGKSMFAASLMDAVEDPGVLSGEVLYYTDDGQEVDVLDLNKEELKRLRWEEISMVFQGALDSFNPTQTIEGHFKETILAHDMNLEEQMEFGRQLLADLYLEPDRVLESYPHELSGGMQQRALIALSLLLKPNVLVMDEPTGALDLLMQRSITSLLAELQETYNLTIIFITHDLPLVTGLADRLAVMYAFQFVEHGPTYDILRDAAHPYTRSLLKAVPNIEAPREDMEPIEGDSPDPVNVPAGCAYHPRCPLADEQCRTDAPDFHDTGENRVAACYHWEDASEAIPYTLSQEETD